MEKAVITRHPMEWAIGSLSPALTWPDSVERIDTVTVNRITIADLFAALQQGFADFAAYRTDAILLCIIYPAVGILLGRMGLGHGLLPLLFPFVAGFALLGPLLATGLYEMSRRREHGDPVNWGAAFAPFGKPAIEPIMALGMVLLAIFGLWLLTAALIYRATLGAADPASAGDFATRIFTTGGGLALIIFGIGAGAIFAAVTFSISVISFPLLLDRNIGVRPAVLASLQAVRLNPVPMLAWGAIVCGLLALGSLPLLIGLAITMPVLGHATWHLYRRLIGPPPG
jgi:uncharacterized membrane protein